jgi:hypothetical protein
MKTFQRLATVGLRTEWHKVKGCWTVSPQPVRDATGPERRAKAIRRFIGLAPREGLRWLILMPLGCQPEGRPPEEAV